MNICETFSGNSLKEDLSIDTTFDPCSFLWDSLFKVEPKWTAHQEMPGIVNNWLGKCCMNVLLFVYSLAEQLNFQIHIQSTF